MFLAHVCLGNIALFGKIRSSVREMPCCSAASSAAAHIEFIERFDARFQKRHY